MTVPADRSPHPPSGPDGGDTCAVVVGGGPFAAAAVAELTQVVGDVERAEEAERLASWEPPPGHRVALVVLLDHEEGPAVDQVVSDLLDRPAFAQARLLVVTTRSSLTDMSGSVDSGRVDGVVAAPWTPGNLARYATAQVLRATRAGAPGPGEHHRSELLRRLSMGADAAAGDLLEQLEEVLGPRPRVHLRKGVRITVPDTRLDQVFLVVRGRVALTVTSAAGEVVLHHASTGPLVGLLALTEMQHSTVTARTTTECEVVTLTLEQLDRALTQDPRVGASLTALTVRALATRLRRSEQLHVKNATLTAELRSTLDELHAARAGLVEQARLATLGELAAGFAHELNNPAATVARGVEHLADDLRELLAEEPAAQGAGVVLDALVTAEERDHVPAREERALRRALGEAVGDRTLARRLVAAGVTDPDRARALLRGPPQLLARVERAAGIGSALRSVRVAAHHIATLVSALQAHARPGSPEDELDEPTDVAATVQDALRLLEHRLRPVVVDVRTDPDLPPVLSGPGLLTQVWTNLLSNAADALARATPGHVSVRVTGCWPPDQAGRSASSPFPAPAVRVEVEDDGPGVPEGLREQIFTPRFTTKRGVVRYGLGLGLGIARSIVARHGGRIALDSRPGRTVFSVVLPTVGSPPLTTEPLTTTPPTPEPLAPGSRVPEEET